MLTSVTGVPARGYAPLQLTALRRARSQLFCFSETVPV